MIGPQQVSSFHAVILVLVSVTPTSWVCEGFKVAAPEFADPLKNISVSTGSNIELFCNVRHLGANRIMWMRKEDNKQALLAINALVITNNPRITVSLLPSSGDVSRSILYIYAAEYEDSGVYHCIVNSSPVISQMGILEIKQPTTTEVVPPSVVMDYHTTASPEATTSAANIEISHDLKICNTSGCDTTKSDLTQTTPMFCIDIAGLWTQTRHGAQYLLSWLYKYVHPIF